MLKKIIAGVPSVSVAAVGVIGLLLKGTPAACAR